MSHWAGRNQSFERKMLDPRLRARVSHRRHRFFPRNLESRWHFAIFGMAFDPISELPWNKENGDDSFDEINPVPAGANNGWVQIMGPVNRIADYKGIETSPRYFGLQQVRWPPTLIADTPSDARARLVMLSGAFYNDPLFSWKYAVAPSPLGFLSGDGLGPEYNGSL